MSSSPRVTGAWDRDGIAAFLEDAVVPVRLACRTSSGPLWIVSLWYRWREEGGEDDQADGGGDPVFHCATGADADVVGYLEHDDGVAFEVSTNDVPYRGVRGHGTATVTPDEDKATLRALLERYLGGTDVALARRLLDDDRDEVRITVRPERLYSWDFSDSMADVAETTQ